VDVEEDLPRRDLVGQGGVHVVGRVPRHAEVRERLARAARARGSVPAAALVALAATRNGEESYPRRARAELGGPRPSLAASHAYLQRRLTGQGIVTDACSRLLLEPSQSLIVRRLRARSSSGSGSSSTPFAPSRSIACRILPSPSQNAMCVVRLSSPYVTRSPRRRSVGASSVPTASCWSASRGTSR